MKIQKTFTKSRLRGLHETRYRVDVNISPTPYEREVLEIVFKIEHPEDEEEDTKLRLKMTKKEAYKFADSILYIASKAADLK